MPSISITDLNNAKLDVDHIAAIATSSALTAIDRLGGVKSTMLGAVNTIKAFNSRGAWVTGTAYAIKDVYTNGGLAYVTLIAHTSAAAIATDLAAGNVTIYQGALTSAIASPVTSAYGVFTDALAAAAGGTLVINSAVAITANTTIPNTVSIQVVKPGMFTVSSGVTLTINGEVIAPSLQIFAGAGVVVFGTNSRAIRPEAWFSGAVGAVFNTNRTLLQSPTEVGGPVHAYEDHNTLNFTNPTAANFNAYASFDAQVQITGTASYDHHVGFQARATYSGSGSIWSRWDQFNSFPTASGSGTIANIRHFRAEDVGGSGGAISFQAAFYCENLTRATDNYGLFSKTTQNTVRTAAGQAANLILQGNGQVGGFGLLFQSKANSNGLILQTANAPIEIGTNNSIHSIITADGRWKFGTTTDLVGATSPLDVVGTNGTILKISSGLNPCVLQWSAAAAGDNVFSAFYTEAGITQRGSIDYNRAGGLTRYNTTSDKTLKTRIGAAPAEKSLAILDSTVLEEYFWNDDPTKKPQIGPFAQDLYKTFKGAVSVGGEYKEDGVKKYRPWGVDKTAFTFHLVAGYQHQQRQIADLMQRVEAQEKALQKLQS